MRRKPGKREREARKRHRRAWVWLYDNLTVVSNFRHHVWNRLSGADPKPLKLGRKHFRRGGHLDLPVSDSRKANKS